jgi:hypothetical protein
MKNQKRITLRIDTVDTLLQKNILPAVRGMIQRSVESEIEQAVIRLRTQLAGVAIDAADCIRLVAHGITERDGVQIDVVVAMEKLHGS